MPDPHFLQIHSLHGYSAVLLNRDDSGLAKRMLYGGRSRTRISSQCLKRHWRMSEGENAIGGIDGATAAVRSRETVTRRVIDPLIQQGYRENVVEEIRNEFQKAVYGDKGAERSGRQPLLLGEPEIKYLAREARAIADAHPDDADSTQKAAKQWASQAKQNMKAMRESCKIPGSLLAALFGRMVTSDVEANIDAAIHVAHAFTVHEEESESDYFTVVDDLHQSEDELGAAHIGETELTSGLFYGYVVVDRGMLLENLADDAEMAGEVVRRLVHLIASVSPGAKLGSTAPYAYANWLMIEAGDHQPRSLAEAFREACQPTVVAAEHAIQEHLERLDGCYGCHEVRQYMSLAGGTVPNAEAGSLANIADWAGTAIRTGTA